MKAGKLRHLVTIERPQKVRQASGDMVTEWVSFLEDIYARITPLKGRELFHAQTILPQATHEVEIRYHDGVTSDMRVNFSGRLLQIGDVPRNHEERDVNLVFLCVEST